MIPRVDPGAAGRPEPAPRWYAHTWNRAIVYRLGAGAASALPRRARLGLAAALAPLVPVPTERAQVQANLARVLPDASAPRRASIARAVFRYFAMCFVDLITTNRATTGLDDLLGEVEGREHLEVATARGHGLVLLTAHFGNWELAGRLLARRDGRPTHVVVAREPDPAVERFLRGGPAPVRFVRREHPAASVTLLAALRRDEIVAMQGDRALGTRGDVPVDFFGTPAPFPLGPFLLARAAGAPVVPVFCMLRPDRRYLIRLHAPLSVAPGTERAALGQWVTMLEGAIRRAPEQWFNFFDVWNGAEAR